MLGLWWMAPLGGLRLTWETSLAAACALLVDVVVAKAAVVLLATAPEVVVVKAEDAVIDRAGATVEGTEGDGAALGLREKPPVAITPTNAPTTSAPATKARTTKVPMPLASAASLARGRPPALVLTGQG